MLQCRISNQEILDLVFKHEVHWIFALHGPRHYGLDPGIAKSLVWIQVQHGADSYLESSGTEDATIFASYSDDWLMHHLRKVPENAYSIGCPALDAIEITKKEILIKYRIPIGNPIITYFTNDHPLLCWVPGILNRIWYQYVFCDDLWPMRWIPEFLSKITVTELTLVKCLRNYVDSVGGVLILKSRSKRKLTPTLIQHAHTVLYDEMYYPATNLELLKISNLVICITSTAKIEAEYFGVNGFSLYPEKLASYFEPFIKKLFPSIVKKTNVKTVEDFVSLLRKDKQNFLFEGLNYSSTIFGPRDYLSANRLVQLAIEHEVKLNKKIFKDNLI
jgi:hypothetical protein